MKKSISFYTLGCRLNQAETAVMENSFAVRNYQIVDFNQPADVVVVNTCTVTENGDADTRRLINKINRINPHAQIALVGCQAQVQKERLAAYKNVRWIVGNARKMDLSDILEKADSSRRHAELITPTITRQPFTMPVAGITSKLTRANLKIQDGCDLFCSFCEIPYARGRARSRRFEDILKEARALVEAGHQEVVLTGINIGTYQDQGYGILDVIKALEEIRALARIRISSIEPTTIAPSVIQHMAASKKLCSHLHIPLQSAADEVLNAMRRNYTLEYFNDLIQMAVQTVPEVCIGTDVIVGFPGESDALFSKTENFLKVAPIHYFHVFSYSQRTMTRSRQFTTMVEPGSIKQRSRQLRALSARKRALFYEDQIGRTVEVLFEQRKEDRWSGLTDNYTRVFAAGQASIAGQRHLVLLRNNHQTYLEGVLVRNTHEEVF